MLERETDSFGIHTRWSNFTRTREGQPYHIQICPVDVFFAFLLRSRGLKLEVFHVNLQRT